MIRPARPDDTAIIVRFIEELAEYEKLRDQCEASPARIGEHLFGKAPLCEALIAEEDGAPVGFALFFRTYSTFKASTCLHLEDLWVRPAARGKGHGKALLHELARLALARGVPRVTWNVLDWNELAIRFYESLGASVLPDWRIARVEGAQIARFAERSRA